MTTPSPALLSSTVSYGNIFSSTTVVLRQCYPGLEVWAILSGSVQKCGKWVRLTASFRQPKPKGGWDRLAMRIVLSLLALRRAKKLHIVAVRKCSAYFKLYKLYSMQNLASFNGTRDRNITAGLFYRPVRIRLYLFSRNYVVDALCCVIMERRMHLNCLEVKLIKSTFQSLHIHLALNMEFGY